MRRDNKIDKNVISYNDYTIYFGSKVHDLWTELTNEFA